MAYFLILLSCAQFILRSMMLQETPLYAFLNPYVLLLPLLLIWLGDYCLRHRTQDKNLLVGLMVVAAIQVFVLPAYSRSPNFMALYLKSIQYFWGPAILLPCLLGLLRLWPAERNPMGTARTYICGLAGIVAAVTIFERIAVNLFGISPFSLPWIAPERYLDSIDINPFRPWGVSIYPQVNALMLALLFWLSYLYRARGLLHRLALLFALGISFGGTGILAFVALLPLNVRRPILGLAVSGIIAGSLVAATMLTFQHNTSGILEKLDVNYALAMASQVSRVAGSYFRQLSADDVMFGSQTVTQYSAVGITHDWGYFDVFYAYGVIGLVGYVLLYGILIYLACPREAGSLRRFYFVSVVLAMNFHYGALNYYLGQFLFSTLAALQLQRPFMRARNPQGRNAAIVASSGVVA